jgi:tetratricopeptide (TPR) repeat protein
MRLQRLLTVGFLLCCFGWTQARADTIVLKNGRRIVALQVFEEGEKIRYLTSAGELTLPKRIVDHIEKGGAAIPDSSGAAASKLDIAPPTIEANATNVEVGRRAVRDGGVDRDFLSSLEEEARSGSGEAVQKAAIARHAVAQFEMMRGDLDHALIDERAALAYTPEDPMILLSVAYLHLRRSEFKQALELVERARRVAPDNPEVSKLAGWAYYGMNKLNQAVAEWQHALAIRPDREVQAALEKTLRDKQEEENYRENESSHFTLKYTGEAEPELAREVLRALEMHFNAIESELSYTPAEPIGVILYTQQAFADITRAPGWAGALNDGRIRVPVQGLTQLTPDLSRVLKHELTHSFVRQKTRGLAPTWVQEGLAQWIEGKRVQPAAGVLVKNYEEKLAKPVGDLEKPWMQFSPEDAAYAYAWSLAMVEFIVQTEGMSDMHRVLDRIGAGSPTEAAVHEILRRNYDELLQDTTQYLKKTYGN